MFFFFFFFLIIILAAGICLEKVDYVLYDHVIEKGHYFLKIICYFLLFKIKIINTISTFIF